MAYSITEFSLHNKYYLAFSKNNGTVTPSSAMPLVNRKYQLWVLKCLYQPKFQNLKQHLQHCRRGCCVTSPLVGVAYLKPAPDNQTLSLLAMRLKKVTLLCWLLKLWKLWMRFPAPRDGIVTEILVQAEAMVERWGELVRIKWLILIRLKKRCHIVIPCYSLTVSSHMMKNEITALKCDH